MKPIRLAISFLKSSVLILAIALTVLLILTAIPMSPIDKSRDIYGFGEYTDKSQIEIRRYTARDGTQLAFQFYDADAETLLIFVHGSSADGADYHLLANHISQAGVAKVYLPNMRGHYLSGQRRGDCDYIGQLEDDIADLIGLARRNGHTGPVVIGGHSSGGGFAIRFAGGAHGSLASAYVLLSPIILKAPTIKPGNADWAQVNRLRIIGLIGLNILGIHGFDGLPIVHYNKPETYWDGTETLAYTWRLNVSMHPRLPNYKSDLSNMQVPVLVMCGEKDESNAASAYQPLFEETCPQAEVVILPGITHFGVFTDTAALDRIVDWISKLNLQ